MGYYDTAVQNATVGQVLTPLEYASLVLAGSAATVNANHYTIDNSSSEWDSAQANGNSIFVVKDPANNVIYFGHANYVGAQVSDTLENFNLPAGAQILAGIEAADTPAWEVIVGGVAIIALAVALVVVTGGLAAPTLFLAAAATIALLGATAVVLGAYGAIFTPTVTNTTCNTGSSSCCVDFEAPGGVGSTCTDCTSGACVSSTSTTPVGTSIGSELTSIGIGLAVIAAVGIGGYVTYKVVSSHKYGPKSTSAPYSPPPQAPAPAGPSFGQRAGSTLRRAGSYAKQQTEDFVAGVRGY